MNNLEVSGEAGRYDTGLRKVNGCNRARVVDDEVVWVYIGLAEDQRLPGEAFNTTLSFCQA